jgi:hypothetical protein
VCFQAARPLHVRPTMTKTPTCRPKLPRTLSTRDLVTVTGGGEPVRIDFKNNASTTFQDSWADQK